MTSLPPDPSSVLGQAPAPAAALRRVAKLTSLVDSAGLDAYLVTSDESIAYLSGFRPLQLERLFAVVVRGRDASLLLPALDAGQVKAGPLRSVSYEATSNGIEELLGELAGCRRVGVEEDHLVLKRARIIETSGLELVAAGSLMLSERARKDAHEVELVRRACAEVERVITRLFDELRPGDIERDVNARVEGWLREGGATAVHPLVLFGRNGAHPHAEPGPSMLKVGDVVCADVSACIDGYWGDLTRCATVGPADAWARQGWEVVRQAHSAAISASRAWNSAGQVDQAQREILDASVSLGRCLHGAGHAIGLAIHEPPFLVPGNETKLEPGMILTIEPGLYNPDYGGLRLEDDVLVTDSDPIVLSPGLPRELFEIPIE